MKELDWVLYDVRDEIAKQDLKWSADRWLDYFEWTTILTEEVGEFAKASLHTKYGGYESGNMYKEIIQVAAVALQIANSLKLEENGY